MIGLDVSRSHILSGPSGGLRNGNSVLIYCQIVIGFAAVLRRVFKRTVESDSHALKRIVYRAIRRVNVDGNRKIFFIFGNFGEARKGIAAAYGNRALVLPRQIPSAVAALGFDYVVFDYKFPADDV